LNTVDETELETETLARQQQQHQQHQQLCKYNKYKKKSNNKSQKFLIKFTFHIIEKLYKSSGKLSTRNYDTI